MNWIEIIDVRSPGNGIEQISKMLTSPVMKNDQKEGLKGISLYRNALVETDISIHLHWETNENPPKKSDLGLRLASALEEFGRVNHALWIKEEGGIK